MTKSLNNVLAFASRLAESVGRKSVDVNDILRQAPTVVEIDAALEEADAEIAKAEAAIAGIKMARQSTNKRLEMLEGKMQSIAQDQAQLRVSLERNDKAIDSEYKNIRLAAENKRSVHQLMGRLNIAVEGMHDDGNQFVKLMQLGTTGRR